MVFADDLGVLKVILPTNDSRTYVDGNKVTAEGAVASTRVAKGYHAIRIYLKSGIEVCNKWVYVDSGETMIEDQSFADWGTGMAFSMGYSNAEFRIDGRMSDETRILSPQYDLSITYTGKLFVRGLYYDYGQTLATSSGLFNDAFGRDTSLTTYKVGIGIKFNIIDGIRTGARINESMWYMGSDKEFKHLIYLPGYEYFIELQNINMEIGCYSLVNQADSRYLDEKDVPLHIVGYYLAYKFYL